MILLMSLLFTILLGTLGGALVLGTVAERQAAASHQRGVELLYAADGAVELALQDLAAVADWSDVLSGRVRSSFIDGGPGGSRTLADGTTIDLTALTNVVRCGDTSGCTNAELDAATADRPWGTNNPRWELFAYGALEGLPGVRSPAYIVVWVGDDAAERDGKPLVDGGPSIDGIANAGAGIVTLLGHAYGIRGSRRIVEMAVQRVPGGLRLVAWREIRQ